MSAAPSPKSSARRQASSSSGNDEEKRKQRLSNIFRSPTNIAKLRSAEERRHDQYLDLLTALEYMVEEIREKDAMLAKYKTSLESKESELTQLRREMTGKQAEIAALKSQVSSLSQNEPVRSTTTPVLPPRNTDKSASPKQPAPLTPVPGAVAPGTVGFRAGGKDRRVPQRSASSEPRVQPGGLSPLTPVSNPSSPRHSQAPGDDGMLNELDTAFNDLVSVNFASSVVNFTSVVDYESTSSLSASRKRAEKRVGTSTSANSEPEMLPGGRVRGSTIPEEAESVDPDVIDSPLDHVTSLETSRALEELAHGSVSAVMFSSISTGKGGGINFADLAAKYDTGGPASKSSTLQLASVGPSSKAAVRSRSDAVLGRRAQVQESENAPAQAAARVKRIPDFLLAAWLQCNSTDRPSLRKQALLETLIEPGLDLAMAISRVSCDDSLVRHLTLTLGAYDQLPYLVTCLIEDEVEGAIAHNTLFRANTMTSKLLTSAAKLVGKPFIRKTIASEIAAICSFTADLKNLKMSPEAETVQLQAHLGRSAQALFDSIVASVESTPNVIHHFCHILSTTVATRFPDHALISVGGFMFLRIFCPAIVAPEIYGMVDVKPSREARQNLIHVSKLLQNLANGVDAADRLGPGPNDDNYLDLNLAEFMEKNMEALQTYYRRMSEPAPERDDISPNLNNLPRALVEEGLGGIQRHIAESITEIAAELGNAEATMTVTYHVVANMDSVAKKLIDRPSDRDVVSNFVNCLLKHDLQIVDALVAFMEGRRQAVGVLEDFYLALVRVMWLYGPEQLSQFLEKTVVSDFESQKSLNDVLVKSAGSRFANAYLKVTGSGYLKASVKDVLEEVIADGRCLEVEAFRVTNGASTKKNMTDLIGYAGKVIDSVIKSVEHLPSEIHALVNMAGRLAVNRFGADGANFGAEFLILRFVLPALVSPQKFEIVPEQATADVRRTLILLSKTLRHTVLDTRFSTAGFDELNAFIESRVPDMRAFFDAVQSGSLEPIQQAVYVSGQSKREGALLLAELATDPEFQGLVDIETATETLRYKVFDRVSAVLALGRFQERSVPGDVS